MFKTVYSLTLKLRKNTWALCKSLSVASCETNGSNQPLHLYHKSPEKERIIFQTAINSNNCCLYLNQENATGTVPNTPPVAHEVRQAATVRTTMSLLEETVRRSTHRTAAKRIRHYTIIQNGKQCFTKAQNCKASKQARLFTLVTLVIYCREIFE